MIGGLVVLLVLVGGSSLALVLRLVLMLVLLVFVVTVAYAVPRDAPPLP